MRQQLNLALTPVVDTSGAHAAGDVIFTTEAISPTSASGQTFVLENLVMIDGDNNSAAQVDLYFFDSDVALGTKNAAPSISLADLKKATAVVSILASDWKTANSKKIASLGKYDLGQRLSMKSGTGSLYVAGVTQGTPTYTGNNLFLRLTLNRED